MDDLPSLSARAVGSRFVSSDDIEEARARREEQWKAAYARLGQEPPKQQEEFAYDGRSLAEKLAANKIAKQEEWEEKNKLANQFRALEEDEIMFLDSVRERQEAAERQIKESDGQEVQSFKEAVAARVHTVIPPTISERPAVTKKKDKKTLKGVVVKKKAPKPVSPDKPVENDTEERDAKRRKVLES